MDDYDVLEAFYVNCKIHSPVIRNSDPRAKSLWLNSKSKKINFSTPMVVGDKSNSGLCMIMKLELSS